MKIVLSHPTGNSNVREVIKGLDNANFLFEFHTTIATNKDSLWLKFLPQSVRTELLRRSYPITGNLIKSHPGLEIARMVLPKLGFKSLVKHEYGVASVDAVYQNLDRCVAQRLSNMKNKPNAVYAYEDGAACSFKIARQNGIKNIYDLPIGYWRAARRLLDMEKQRWPEWLPTLTGLKDSDEKLAKKDEELRLADHIFVASSFTAKTLEEFPGILPPIDIIPYGFPPAKSTRSYEKIAGRPLKLLFVGGLSQRKGIADLFAAVDAIGDAVQLTIIGKKATDDLPILNMYLAKHKWIESLAHNDILEAMSQHDVLVLPSLFEGFGLVITEAMSQGTPVITTNRTAGPDIIRHGENGWLIEAGSTETLRIQIEKILNNTDAVAKVGEMALRTARNRPWAVYGQEVAAEIAKLK